MSSRPNQFWLRRLNDAAAGCFLAGKIGFLRAGMIGGDRGLSRARLLDVDFFDRGSESRI